MATQGGEKGPSPDPFSYMQAQVGPVGPRGSLGRRGSRAGTGRLGSPDPRDLPASEDWLVCPVSRGPRATGDSLDWMEPREVSADLAPKERTDHRDPWELRDL